MNENLFVNLKKLHLVIKESRSPKIILMERYAVSVNWHFSLISIVTVPSS